jgi:hypothetical protein
LLNKPAGRNGIGSRSVDAGLLLYFRLAAYGVCHAVVCGIRRNGLVLLGLVTG